MKKQKLTVLIILTAISFSWAQKIEVKSAFTGYKFIEQGERISRKDLLEKFESHNEAFTLLKKANTGNTFQIISSTIGGVLIGIPLGGYVAGRSSSNWALAYIGGALTVASIPIYIKSVKNAKKAINIYNSESSALTTNTFKPQLNFNINANEAGLALSF